MSILIQGMKMPIGCASCFVDRAYCRLWKKVPCGKWRDERHPDCPLIELPSHGRLIDADAIQDYNVETFGQRLLIIDTAPTVIEAEGSET